ncbi:DUF4132 domain-containing protein [Longispora fulva]|uniref:DUF4132 domain-containing protein n=1 Tax=Longispora fulva TaxID=619741 RepID=A0A8J7KNG1_9ACTN|nr:DUF4132 domain-containing protein [Longispora fulva]MBG6141574.1 hypothetical protein [Longispora fulva]
MRATECGTDTSAATRRDEDTLIIPSDWRQVIVPRRGGVPGPEMRPKMTTPRELLGRGAAAIDRVLDGISGDPDRVAAARVYLADGVGAATPVGAAAVLAATLSVLGWERPEKTVALADAWVAGRGVAFAAAALAELADLAAPAPGGRGFASDPGPLQWPRWSPVACRVRAHVAAVGDTDHAEVVRALEAFRGGSARQRATTSFLVPTETAWPDADCRRFGEHSDVVVRLMLWCAAGTGEQFRLAAAKLAMHEIGGDLGLLVTAAEGAGAAGAEALAHILVDMIDSERGAADARQRVLSVLAALPGDAAMAVLVERLDHRYFAPAMAVAAERFPVRAARLLAAAAAIDSGAGRTAGQLLHGHALSHPDAVEAARPALGGAARDVLAVLVDRAGSVPATEADALPAMLVSPPWTRPRRRTTPAVLDLPRTSAASIAWTAGECDVWMSARSSSPRWDPNRSWEQGVAEFAAGRLRHHEEQGLFADGPVELVGPWVSAWRVADMEDAAGWMPRIVARFELDALPVALAAARSQPATAAGLLLPYTGPEVTEFMVHALGLRSVRSVALAWLARHAGTVAHALVPDALGRPGARRRAAEQALLLIATRSGRDQVTAPAAGYGDAAGAAIGALLAADPLETLPSRIPALPDWADPETLPQVLSRDRTTALPPAAVGHLCTMLAISRPGAPYAGIAVVREVADPPSLAEFGWVVFQRWLLAGAPTKESWAFDALRWLGDDATVHRLAALIRSWPAEGAHARAATGLDVLAAIGTDVALRHLDGLARRAAFRALRRKAADRIGEVAAERGLTADQLADRLVPDLGLDPRGALVLDYGPRSFTVGFDERLKPYVTDGSGARRKDLPKPGARDDAETAAAAYTVFGGLRKAVRAIAADQIRRLERAMVTRRGWTAAEFGALIVDHPLVGRLAGSLVWTVVDGDGGVRAAFRVAEDRTFVDVGDDAYALADDATVTVAHPLCLGDTVAAWSEVFDDRGIPQPFPQLAREVYALTDAEAGARTLTRFGRAVVPVGRLLGLERRGWQRGTPQDEGIQAWMHMVVAGGRAIVVNLDPGIAAGAVTELPEQRVEHVWVNDGPTGDWCPRGSLRLGDLDPVTASELLRDLTEVTA